MSQPSDRNRRIDPPPERIPSESVADRHEPVPESFAQTDRSLCALKRQQQDDHRHYHNRYECKYSFHDISHLLLLLIFEINKIMLLYHQALLFYSGKRVVNDTHSHCALLRAHVCCRQAAISRAGAPLRGTLIKRDGNNHASVCCRLFL